EKARETGRDGSFIAYANGTVTDSKTGLMWAAKDNGKSINWKGAKEYCENYRGGEYKDWRLPTLDELETVYDSKNGYSMDCNEDYKVYSAKLIHISCWRVWTSETRGSEAAYFSFNYGSRYWGLQSNSYNGRVLPVRGGK
ncbi:MAG: DUF1566 domain-containing protein, partial [bacterium]|nr:DUF1566 domain-containing protein [bacterium]